MSDTDSVGHATPRQVRDARIIALIALGFGVIATVNTFAPWPRSEVRAQRFVLVNEYHDELGEMGVTATGRPSLRFWSETSPQTWVEMTDWGIEIHGPYGSGSGLTMRFGDEGPIRRLELGRRGFSWEAWDGEGASLKWVSLGTGLLWKGPRLQIVSDPNVWLVGSEAPDDYFPGTPADGWEVHRVVWR